MVSYFPFPKYPSSVFKVEISIKKHSKPHKNQWEGISGRERRPWLWWCWGSAAWMSSGLSKIPSDLLPGLADFTGCRILHKCIDISVTFSTSLFVRQIWTKPAWIFLLLIPVRVDCCSENPHSRNNAKLVWGLRWWYQKVSNSWILPHSKQVGREFLVPV